MTIVNEVTRRRDHIAAGSATFVYDFPILSSDDLRVLLDGVLTTAYVVNGVGADAGGTIVMNVTPANGVKVTILGDQPYKQISTYTLEAFPTQRIQNDFNHLAISDQQIVEVLRRAVRAPEVDNLDMTLPSVASRAARILGFDSSGLPTSVAVPVATVGGDVSLATAIASGSITARSLATRFSEIVNVKDYGAVGNGTTDDTTALAAAIVAAAGKTLFFPAGTYLTTLALVLLTAGSRLLGSGRDSTIIKTTAAVNAIRVSAEQTTISDMTLSGNSVGLNGLVLHNANQSSFERMKITGFTQDGVRWDTAAAAPTGNNNTVRLYLVFSTANNRGFAVPTFQTDNNAAVLIGCVPNGNTSHGILYKGQSLLVLGGLVQSNGGYGIQLSEPGDASFTVGAIILGAHIEANTSGGMRGGGKSTRNMLLRDANSQGVTNAAGSEDFEIVVDNSSGGVLTLAAQIFSTTLRFGGTFSTPNGTLANGIQLGAPTGGDKGVGSINIAGSYYKNNALVALQSSFESSDQTVTLSSTLNVAHGLGAKPKLVMVSLKNATAEHNYAVGDEIPLAGVLVETAASTQGAHAVMDATNVTIITAATLNVRNKTTQASAAITAGSWKYVVRAWL